MNADPAIKTVDNRTSKAAFFGFCIRVQRLLKFDAETTRILDIAYQGADITRRRRASFDAIRPSGGDAILDLGCGNGLLTAELARAVGHSGRVIGVDPSADMLKSARERCREFDWVAFRDGAANPLPVDSASIDKAVSLQVFEYLDDLPAASAELFRALRPGGIVAIGDMHFDTLVWHSDDTARMADMIASWDHHLVERCVPAILPPVLRNAGFVVDEVVALPFTDHILRPDGLANVMLHLMQAYAVQNEHMSAVDAAAWAQEQHELAAQGRFFFSLTHFVVIARKP